MAYRRRQVVTRSSTFKEEINVNGNELLDDHNQNDGSMSAPSFFSSIHNSLATPSFNNSLAAQAIKASAARRDPSLSFAPPLHHENHNRSKSCDSDGDPSKSGFWGVLALKAKDIFDDDDPSPKLPHHDIQKLRSHSFNTTTIPATQNIAKIGESNLKQQFNQTLGTTNSQSIPETQLKASRDVAMATAAKAKLLLRELKTVKADLAFAKARCSQLEEENKLLRDKEGREKGQNRADDDLIRLQLETLLAEKARLASENEVNSRENRFLREIVEYHQLTVQDVVQFDEDMEHDSELYGSIDTTYGPQMLSPRSQVAGLPMHSKSMFDVSPPSSHDEATPTSN
ncbi:unnamed protein product [Lathyrus sativus]|nr:unnamed protein product [Lathyrus sativus]